MRRCPHQAPQRSGAQGAGGYPERRCPTTMARWALSLVVGPAHAGKVGTLLDGFVAALDRDPWLIVPKRADVERVERELARRCRAACSPARSARSTRSSTRWRAGTVGAGGCSARPSAACCVRRLSGGSLGRRGPFLRVCRRASGARWPSSTARCSSRTTSPSRSPRSPGRTATGLDRLDAWDRGISAASPSSG